MFEFGSNENKKACEFQHGRLVFIAGLLIGYLAQVTVLSTAASLLLFDRSAGEIYIFGASSTALVGVVFMFWFLRSGKINSAAISTFAAFAVKLSFIPALLTLASIENQFLLWSIVFVLFVLDALPFLVLTILLFRGAVRSETGA